MTSTFTKVSAGIYEINNNSETVGFIRKVTASKWMIADVIDTPLGVHKTLKEAKNAVECGYVKFEVEKVDNTPEPEYNESVQDEKVDESLNTKVQGSLHTYKQIPGTDKFEEVCPSTFGFEPTLEPVEF